MIKFFIKEWRKKSKRNLKEKTEEFNTNRVIEKSERTIKCFRCLPSEIVIRYLRLFKKQYVKDCKILKVTLKKKFDTGQILSWKFQGFV